jgi:hypothetical protein
MEEIMIIKRENFGENSPEVKIFILLSKVFKKY